MEKFRNMPWTYIELLMAEGSVVTFGQDSRIFAENLSSDHYQTILVNDADVDRYLTDEGTHESFAVLLNWRKSNSPMNDEAFIKAICEKFDNILFSSELTEGHWPSYWMRIFGDNQKVVSLHPREFFWDSETMFPTFKQSVFLASNLTPTHDQSRILDLVHPEYYIAQSRKTSKTKTPFKIRLLDIVGHRNRNRIKAILPNFLVRQIKSWIRKHK